MYIYIYIYYAERDTLDRCSTLFGARRVSNRLLKPSAHL